MLINVCLLANLLVVAAGDSASDAPGPTLGQAQTSQWRFGITVSATKGAGKNVSASVPFPQDWSEQKVKIVSKDVPADAKLAFKQLPGNLATQMTVSVPNLPQGKDRQAIVTVEVERWALLPPTQTTDLVIPNAKKLKPDVQAWLAPSHYIESDHPKLRTQAKETFATKQVAWEQVEALYDWSRANIKDRKPQGLGAVKAIEAGQGDMVEISSVFIALCRVSGVPARLVWLPRHCYPEFYLEDAAGRGTWFPCRAAGKREFGGLTEYRPILSKGDRFPDANKPKETQRFVAESATGFGDAPPQLTVLRELVK